MDIKQEPQDPVFHKEDSKCEVIEVIDLTKQVEKDAGQTMAKLN